MFAVHVHTHSPGKGNSNFCICDPAGEHVSMRASVRELYYIFLCLDRDESLLVCRIWMKKFDLKFMLLETTGSLNSGPIRESKVRSKIPSGQWYAQFDDKIESLAAHSPGKRNANSRICDPATEHLSK